MKFDLIHLMIIALMTAFIGALCDHVFSVSPNKQIIDIAIEQVYKQQAYRMVAAAYHKDLYKTSWEKSLVVVDTKASVLQPLVKKQAEKEIK